MRAEGNLGLVEAFRKIYQQVWMLRGAVLQNKLSEGSIKENLSCLAVGGGREVIGSGAPGWVNPRISTRGTSCQFPLGAVMGLYLESTG